MSLRFTTGRQSNHDNGNAARMKEASRHSAVQLSWGSVARVLGNIMNGINEG